MQNFEEILNAELETPATYNVLDEHGNKIKKQISPIEAMVKSVVNNAMKGDLSSIQFVRMLTREYNKEDEQAAKERHAKRIKETEDAIKKELGEHHAYCNQNSEINVVAEIKLLLEDLDEIINSSDFQIFTTDYKNGHQNISPVITLRDKQREIFQQQLDKLRTDGINRNRQMKTRFNL